MSEKTLYGQLLILQGSLDELDLGKDADGQVGSRTYKYLTLDKLHAQVLPLLGKLGLVWNTFPTSIDGKSALRYVLRHTESGEEIGDTMLLLLSDETSQGLGSAITYARRYSLAAVLGLTPEEDDDGAAASNRGSASGPPSRQTVSVQRQVVAKSDGGQVMPASGKQRGLINFKASKACLPPVVLASIVAQAIDQPRDFEDEDAAQQWLKRTMDRLPWTAVDPILKGIEKATI